MIRRKYKKKTYRRKRVYKRRIHRPIGSGMQGKRYMKLRLVGDYTSVPSAPFSSTFIYDNPNQASEWPSVATLFDSYRCCAMKFKYIPGYTTSDMAETTVTGGAGYLNVPVYCVFDYNSILSTLPSSIDSLVEYDNLKIYHLNRVFTYYKKCRRNIPINTSLTTQVSIQNKGYIPTNTPVATQTMWITDPAWGTSSGSTHIGTYIITWYCVFKDRR